MGAEDFDLKYELPILDITACIFAIITILLTVFTIYLSNETRKNTERTADNLEVNNKQALVLAEILKEIRDNNYLK